MTLGLAIVGYGKMGRLIEQLGPEYGFEVRAKFNSQNNLHGTGLTPATLSDIDVAVEALRAVAHSSASAEPVRTVA